MNCLTRMPRRSLGLFLLMVGAAVFLGGCSDSTRDPGLPANPLSVYTSTGSPTGLPTNGATTGVGAIDQPIVNVPIGNDGRRDHTNAPLLDNWHPGWQQAECLSCHTDQSRIPDHNYADTSLCYLCHGTNGLPGFGDNIPPVIKGIMTSPNLNGVLITWTTDEPAITRLILRTTAGDRMEFPVSADYAMSHKFTVNGLLSGTTYEFEITAIDKNGNRSTTATIGRLYFTTLSPTTTTTATTGTTTPPDNSIIQGPSFADLDKFSVRVLWTTTRPTTCSLDLIDTFLGTKKTLPVGGPATSFDYLLDGLTASRTYHLYIIAEDQFGNKVTGSRNTFTTKQLD